MKNSTGQAIVRLGPLAQAQALAMARRRHLQGLQRNLRFVRSRLLPKRLRINLDETVSRLAERMVRAFQTSALARPSGTIIAVEEELRGQLIPGVLKLGFAVLSKTKVPDVAIYPVEASAQRLERTKKVVERAWKVIKSGVFLPSPSPLHCPTCPFRVPCSQGKW